MAECPAAPLDPAPVTVDHCPAAPLAHPPSTSRASYTTVRCTAQLCRDQVQGTSSPHCNSTPYADAEADAEADGDRVDLMQASRGRLWIVFILFLLLLLVLVFLLIIPAAWKTNPVTWKTIGMF